MYTIPLCAATMYYSWIDKMVKDSFEIVETIMIETEHIEHMTKLKESADRSHSYCCADRSQSYCCRSWKTLC